MAVATLEPQAAPESQPPEFALSRGMMGMYIFLASEVMFFGSMFAMYFYLVGSHQVWPPDGTRAVPFWPLPTINSVVLISSGVTCHFALEALRHNGLLGGERYVAAGLMVLGIALLIVFGALVIPEGAAFEIGLCAAGIVVLAVGIAAILRMGPFRDRRVFYGLWVCTILLGLGFEGGQAFEFLTANINLTTNQFASAFFTMTGFHGAHVAGGLVLLTLILGRSLRGQFSSEHNVGPSAVTLYWHFVDVVWIFLYGILYVLVTAGGGG